MTIKLKNELLLLNLLALGLILAVAFFPLPLLRLPLGLVVVLFFPGYVLLAALFPRAKELGGLERLALSLGFSIIIVAGLALILNYTPWGIRLYPFLFSLPLFLLAISAIAWYRRQRLPLEERPILEVKITLARLRWAGGDSLRGKVFSLVLVGLILGAGGVFLYGLVTPTERFTRFYIVGPQGKAEGYPLELKVGEEGKVLLGIDNREALEMSYRVEIKLGGERSGEIGPILLSHGERWEREVGFVPQKAGREVFVEFLLFRGEETTPYRVLHLPLKVAERG